MFLLSNLDRFGIDGTDRRSLRVWQTPGGVVAVTRDGMVLPQWPTGALWPAFAALFAALLGTRDAPLRLALWRDAAWPQRSRDAARVSFSDCARALLKLEHVDLLAAAEL